MAKKENTQEATGFVNPFETGVSMDAFIEALGEKTVAEYVKDQYKGETDGEPSEFTEADVKWLEKEIKNHKYNLKHKDALIAKAHEDYAALIMNNTKKIEQ